MKLEHLQYFVKVVQCGSISKAAAHLYISQPHLSRIIKDMEDAAGVMLLSRRSQGVVPTADGKLYLQHAQNVLDEMGALQSFSRMQSRRNNIFNVSMTRYSHIMESFIDICRSHQNDDRLTFRLEEGTPLEVANDVAEGRADIGVLHFEMPRTEGVPAVLHEKGLVYQKLAVAQPHIILSKNHPLFRQNQPINLDTLVPYGFVRYIGQYEDFTYKVTVNGIGIDLCQTEKIVYIHGRASLMHLISTSDFYSLGIQSFETQQHAYNVMSVPIEGIEERLEFGCLLPQNASPSPIVQEFIASLRQRLSCE